MRLKDFWNDKDMFDNSDYPENSPYYCNANKKVIGKFKDEACGVPIVEFVGLKSKIYSYIKSNEKVERPLRVFNYKRMQLRITSSMKTIKTCYQIMNNYTIE